MCTTSINLQTVEEKMYDNAVNGYNFHISRFNTWMNYYAIFVGALFVGYYTTSTNCNSKFLPLVIILVGLVASLCWLGSLYGYYSWLKSWTQILWLHEEQFLKKKAEQEGKKPDSIDDKLRVYSLVYKEAVKKHGYSTQKITKVFIASAIMAWLYLLTHTIYKCLLPYIKIPYCDVGTCSIIIIGILAFVILAVIVWCYSQTLLSDTKPMYKLCIKDKQYEVNPPKNKIFNPLNS